MRRRRKGKVLRARRWTGSKSSTRGAASYFKDSTAACACVCACRCVSVSAPRFYLARPRSPRTQPIPRKKQKGWDNGVEVHPAWMMIEPLGPSLRNEGIARLVAAAPLPCHFHRAIFFLNFFSYLIFEHDVLPFCTRRLIACGLVGWKKCGGIISSISFFRVTYTPSPLPPPWMRQKRCHVRDYFSY